MSNFLRDQSKVRLDPVDGMFDLRAYAESGDPSIPLCAEMRQYTLAGRVVVSGTTATVSCVHGDMSDRDARRDFDEVLRAMGVSAVIWETHKRGNIRMARRELKQHKRPK